MATLEKFPVRNRWTGEVQFTAEISTTPRMLLRVKLGLAVKWAVENKADLTGANLTGANLTGANLSRADLMGADLTGGRPLGGQPHGGRPLGGQGFRTGHRAHSHTARRFTDWMEEVQERRYRQIAYP